MIQNYKKIKINIDNHYIKKNLIILYKVKKVSIIQTIKNNIYKS